MPNEMITKHFYLPPKDSRLKSFYLCVWGGGVYLCVCMCKYGLICHSRCVEVRGQSWVMSLCVQPCLRQGLLLVSTTYATLVFKGCLSFPSQHKITRITDGCYHALLYMTSVSPCPGSHVCTTNALSTQPSPRALETPLSCILLTSLVLNCMPCKKIVRKKSS